DLAPCEPQRGRQGVAGAQPELGHGGRGARQGAAWDAGQQLVSAEGSTSLMGGTTGTSTQTPGGGAEQAAVNPSLNWPEWASNFAAAHPASPMATAADGSVPDQGPLSAF